MQVDITETVQSLTLSNLLDNKGNVMKIEIFRQVLPALFFLLLAATFSVSQPKKIESAGYEKPGRFTVNYVFYDWKDTSRGRLIPVKIYYPSFEKSDAASFPAIIFSHGLGGNREGYEYLGRHWASRGYISVHLQHIGSDDSVWKNGGKPMQNMRKAALNPLNAVNRAKDVSFAIDRLKEMNKSDKIFSGRLNLNRIGVGGHSFGANTAMMIAGQKAAVSVGLDISYADQRVKAIISMSAPVPKLKSQLPKVYSGIKIPVMHMTGTKDDSPVADTKAAERRLPFEYTDAPDQYFLCFEGGDHMIFSGRPNLGFNDDKKDEHFQEYIKAASAAFWDAYILGDRPARNWLKRGGFAEYLDGSGTFEKK